MIEEMASGVHLYFPASVGTSLYCFEAEAHGCTAVLNHSHFFLILMQPNIVDTSQLLIKWTGHNNTMPSESLKHCVNYYYRQKYVTDYNSTNEKKQNAKQQMYAPLFYYESICMRHARDSSWQPATFLRDAVSFNSVGYLSPNNRLHIF